MKRKLTQQIVKDGSRAVAAYDKIFREISPFFLSLLVERVLKLDIVEFEELKDKLQVTRQLETDTLRKVKDKNGNTYILHIEIESTNDPSIASRMADYFTTLYRIYTLPVKQYVIYIGEDPCKMRDRWELPGLQFSYTLISFSQIPYRTFLDADNPEAHVLALLGDLEGRPVESVAHEILERIVVDSAAQSEKNKRMSQLRMLAQLRNFDFDKVQEEVMTNIISKIFKAESDPFFKLGEKRGLEQGLEQGTRQLIQRLIINTGSTDAEISRITDVPEKEVRSIRAATKKAD